MTEDITVSRQREVLAENIKNLLKSKGISQTDMARDLNIAETTVSSWLNAKRYPGLRNLQRMADYFNVHRSDLTEEKPTNLYEVTPQTIRVPLIGVISCGDPIIAEENIVGYRHESPDTLPSGKLFYLTADGDSMEPTIPNGSQVLIREQSQVENGEIAAILLEGDTEATLKRVKKQGDVIMLVPDNAKHDPIVVSEDNPARVIGKAVRFTQDL
jgi:repressor LexA